MKIATTTLGPYETRFFEWSQFKNLRQVKTGDLVEGLRLTPKQEADLFYNLSTSGLILKLWRGYYLVPPKLPVGGKWSPSPYLMINMYMRGLNAKFQISGPVVFSSYGFSTQMASEFTIYNTQASKKIKIQQYRFNFVKVEKNRIGSITEFEPYGETEKAYFSSIERALFDAVYDYKKFGTLPEAYEWISRVVNDKRADKKNLADVTIQFGNTMARKRIGWLLEKMNLDKSTLGRLLKTIPDNKFLVPLDPRNSTGPINKKWGVIENVEIPT